MRFNISAMNKLSVKMDVKLSCEAKQGYREISIGGPANELNNAGVKENLARFSVM